MPAPQTLPPSGLLTFCLTDIEDSTSLWERDRSGMAAGVAAHEAIVASVVSENSGYLCLEQGEGDATMSVFVRPADAVRAAFAIQQRIESTEAVDLRVRIGVHTGEAEQRGPTYYGPALNRAGRIRALAVGGQTFVSQVTAELAADEVPPGARLRPLGAVQLRGLKRHEEVYALESVDADRWARAETLGRQIIPLGLSSFIGREQEQAELVTLLDSTRLVTIAGPGGAGKTRLATEVARTLPANRDRWIIDLALLTDDTLVAETIAAAIGADSHGGDEPIKRVIRVLGQRERAVLVLDNCEHLVISCAAIARRVLGECPEVTILATSQVPLAVRGEHLLRLTSLDVDDGVRLLAERGAASDADRAQLAEISDRLDGIPLALELAAAHLTTLTPEQILRRLDDDRFHLLGGGASDSRHQTLAAAMDWSVGLLDEGATLLLQRLAIFGGGFTLPAVEAICADDQLASDEIYTRLSDLVAASLVIARQRDGEMRYHLLETVREYATHRLATAAALMSWTLRREGEVWAVDSGGSVVRFRGSAGLRHLATLLAQPGRGVHVLDLSAAKVTEGDDEILDATARAGYRSRLQDLQTELDEAHEANDSGRSAHLQDEIDALTAELTRGTGLGGRARRTATAADRARVSVTKALRSAIAKIAAEAPVVGAHLDSSVKTGMTCSYEPTDGRTVTLST